MGVVHINNGASKFCLNVFIQKLNQCPECQSWWAFVAQEVEHLAEVLYLLQSNIQKGERMCIRAKKHVHGGIQLIV